MNGNPMLSKDVTKVSFQENEQRASLSIEAKVTKLTKRTGLFKVFTCLEKIIGNSISTLRKLNINCNLKSVISYTKNIT